MGMQLCHGCMCACAGTTSQPSMGAIVNALHGTSLATGIDPLWLARLSIYWEQVCTRTTHGRQMVTHERSLL